MTLGNILPEQWRNVTGKVHSGTTWKPREAWAQCRNRRAGKGPNPARAMGQPSRRALLRGRQADEEHGSDAAQCSPREEQLLLTSFALLPSFKAEVSCSSCPGAARARDTTFTKQYPLAAAAAVCSSVLHFHSLLIPLLSLQTS